MERFVPLGNEALAQGALDAGVSGLYAYPGTPSTEIMEYVQRSPEAAERGVHRRWSANEKTAVEAALGMSYAGKRAMACMKHVGLNVAADPFMNAAVIGVNGGLLIVAADDPSMHSSQNEQDSRIYGRFAMIPTLEPSNQQEAYDAARIGFALSEKYSVPVLVRLTTRLSHSRANVVRQESLAENELNIPANLRQFVLLPGVARKRYAELLDKQPCFEQEAEESPLVRYEDGPDKQLGIIACGLAFNYLMENFPDGCPHPVLKISQYPAPRRLIAQLLDTCGEILVLEEGMPVIEEQMRGFPYDEGRIHGRLDGALPRTGELNPALVARALGRDIQTLYLVPEVVVERPPQLCQGCPHADTYRALNAALEPYVKGRVFADIGCYTLGALPPFESINTCVEMGASITMAKGAADAGLTPSVAVIGDSTFSHSGMTGLLDAVQAHAPVTVIILDNETAAMTGGQDSPASAMLEQIAGGLGVAREHVRVITPLPRQHEANAAIIAAELAYEDVSVIIARRECLETARRRKRGQA